MNDKDIHEVQNNLETQAEYEHVWKEPSWNRVTNYSSKERRRRKEARDRHVEKEELKWKAKRWLRHGEFMERTTRAV